MIIRTEDDGSIMIKNEGDINSELELIIEPACNAKYIAFGIRSINNFEVIEKEINGAKYYIFRVVVKNWNEKLNPHLNFD